MPRSQSNTCQDEHSDSEPGSSPGPSNLGVAKQTQTFGLEINKKRKYYEKKKLKKKVSLNKI